MRRSTLSWTSTFAAALLLVAIATDGASQSFQGGLRGAVKDANSVIPGVMVTLLNEGTNASRTTASNELGEYVFASVLPGTYTLFIEQDGNWIQGSHQTDLSVRDIAGTIEGNEVKLRSAALRPAVTFIFVGTVSGETISGPIYMGEYLNARFTARRHSYPPGRTRIVVPGGPPLAT
jgi:hypothetical protein